MTFSPFRSARRALWTALLLAVFTFLVLAETARAAPAMWRVVDGDAEIHLFGTIHSLPPDYDWRTARFERLFEAADIVYFEAASGPEADQEGAILAARYGLNEPNVTLRSKLNPDETRLLERVTRELGVQTAALDPMRPWFAAVVVGLEVITQQGGDPANSVDGALQARALVSGKRVRYLETAEFQLRLFADLTEPMQIAFLMASLEQIENDPDFYDELLESWTSGDEDLLAEILNTSFKESTPIVYERVLTERNRTWTEHIVGLLEGGEDAFFAVGAGHLVGDDSVVDMLRARGYRVERVDLD